MFASNSQIKKIDALRYKPVIYLPDVFDEYTLWRMRNAVTELAKASQNISTGPHMEKYVDPLTIYHSFIERKAAPHIKHYTDFDCGYVAKAYEPFRLHSDGIRHALDDYFLSVLAPISLDGENSERNKFYMFEQKTRHATVFKRDKNTQVNPHYRFATTKEEYDAVLIDPKYGEDNSKVLENCSHLNAEDLDGLSLLEEFPWKPGDLFIFDARYVHVSSNFLDLGIKSKTNLVYSFRLS